MRPLLLIVVSTVLAGACASAQAKVKSPAENPALEVPPAPPRLIEPLPLPPPPPEPVADLPATPPAKPRQQPARDAAKPAAEPAKTEPPAEVGPPTPPATPPTVPPLRTTSTPELAAVRQVTDIIQRAWAILKGISWEGLNKQQQLQYDNAKLFLTQAEESMKAQNYEFARNLAEKAEKIAKELAGK